VKKILIFTLFVALSIVLTISAMADTVTLGGSSSVPTYAGVYVGPVGGTLNSASPIDGGIACLDIANTSYFGSTIGVDISTLQPENMTHARHGYDPAAILNYQKVGWLLGQIPSHSTDVGPIQFAMWKIFNPTYVDSYLTTNYPSAIPLVNSWLVLANAINPNNYDFSSVSIYTPTGSYSSNQEFMSGGAVHTPVPASVLLLGSGLLGMGLVGFRRRQRS
jgi:hypothetical protein